MYKEKRGFTTMPEGKIAIGQSWSFVNYRAFIPDFNSFRWIHILQKLNIRWETLASGTMIVVCPFHKPESLSLELVHEEKSGLWICHCSPIGFSGSKVSFVADVLTTMLRRRSTDNDMKLFLEEMKEFLKQFEPDDPRQQSFEFESFLLE